MFSQHLQEYTQKKYEERRKFLGAVGEAAEKKLTGCTGDEQLLMKFFYGTMPLSDAGKYEFDVFLGFVRHALMVYQTMAWCRDIPEEIFLHHILYYRINSENIEDCRRFFYDHLAERVKGKTMKEAVLEINYWCAENGAYEASDNRTISPMTLYRSGKGRCGEESTFAVTVFRSVGIPARQVYTPRWAHCDDNHAWVEVYVDGKWHFLGACEPEEVLDKGWFTNASSRAVLVHARNFSDYSNGSDEACLGQEDQISFYNVTPAYAKTKELRIYVLEADGAPAEGAQVSVEVLNMGEYSRIAQLCTDKEGKASITIGLGTVHLWVRSRGCDEGVQGGVQSVCQGGAGCEALVNVAETSEITLKLMPGAERERSETGTWHDFDLEAPADYPMHPVKLTREQKETNRRRIREAGRLRCGRIEEYYQEELAEKYPEEKELLRFAAGNFDEIYRFLSKDENPDRKAMLHSLSLKDCKDAKADVLEAHLKGATEYRNVWEEAGKLEIYQKYILCPRVFDEELTDYRKVIRKGAHVHFGACPMEIWSYIKRTIQYDSAQDYRTIFSTPESALKLKFANPMSQKILFVAVCRTFGIPARVNGVTKEAEFYRDGVFVPVDTEADAGTAVQEQAALILRRRAEDSLHYFQNWTIGQLQNGRFVTLDYTGVTFDGDALKLTLEPGIYRILTTNRLPNGNQLASEYRIQLKKDQTAETWMRLRSGKLEELLVSNQLDDFEVTVEGSCVEASKVTGGCMGILAFLEEGQEPTEHVLNEMLEAQEALRAQDAGIWFILQNEAALENATLQKVLKAVPNVRIVYGSFDDIVEPLARRMYTDPEKLPLLIVTDSGLNGIYASSGYNVGSVELMLKLLKLSESVK